MGLIIQEYQLGETKIQIDDSFFPKTEEEKRRNYEEFNRIGCKILYSKD